MYIVHRYLFFVFFQAEDGIRDSSTSRGLGDVYKRQNPFKPNLPLLSDVKTVASLSATPRQSIVIGQYIDKSFADADALTIFICCLLYTSDAADDTPCVDLGGHRIIKKKNQHAPSVCRHIYHT
ncbi:hypothetical protein AMBR_NBBOBCOC_02839 [Lacticaseibacillus rhamnosus]|nr:hypothetical protein AMBR_NBBOBCOC_02839 [Lacticaseibacillus rhamnosus]